MTRLEAARCLSDRILQVNDAPLSESLAVNLPCRRLSGKLPAADTAPLKLDDPSCGVGEPFLTCRGTNRRGL
jgi:hypothetical protein